MRVLFFGTSEFALPTLEALLKAHQVVGVVTQPDRPAGRGQKLHRSPVKGSASARGLHVIQPERLRDPGWPEKLQVLSPEIHVVAAFGQILPKAVLDLPSRGSVNVHPSLLPRYRGAAPIAWALINGETETGMTTFLMDAGMDSGPILLQQAVPILPDEDAGSLTVRLARIGAELLLKTLDALEAGQLTPRPQDQAQATFAPRLKKEDGLLHWHSTATALVNRVRGFTPAPGAFTLWRNRRLTVLSALAIPAATQGDPGSLVPRDGTYAVQTGNGLFLPREVQPESRHAMRWEEFLRGARPKAGERFGDAPE